MEGVEPGVKLVIKISIPSRFPLPLEGGAREEDEEERDEYDEYDARLAIKRDIKFMMAIQCAVPGLGSVEADQTGELKRMVPRIYGVYAGSRMVMGSGGRYHGTVDDSGGSVKSAVGHGDALASRDGLDARADASSENVGGNAWKRKGHVMEDGEKAEMVWAVIMEDGGGEVDLKDVMYHQK